MSLVPLPAQHFNVSGGEKRQILTRMLIPCRPRRLVVPQWSAMDFNVTGVGVVRGDVEGVVDFRLAKRVDFGDWWPGGSSVPAHIFSEAFKELNVEILMPTVRIGDHVFLEIENNNPAHRNFSGGWLVEPTVDE